MWRMGRKYSPIMNRSPLGIRWWTSATRPASVLSIGIMARSAPPFAYGIEGVLEGRAGHGFHGRVNGPAGQIGIGPLHTLEGYFAYVIILGLFNS
jgi:hypothetical protein